MNKSEQKVVLEAAASTLYYHTDGLLKRLSTHKAVGTSVSENDLRLRVGINGRKYYVHQIIYLMGHGKLEGDLIDHIDRNPLNNKLENLRPATYSQNQWNRSKNKNNTSGVKGVAILPSGKLVASVGYKNKRYHVGTFTDMVEAVQARVAYVERLHKEFSCHG